LKKIVTAIGNSRLNNKIKEQKEYKLLSKDIEIDEKLIEFLERGEEIDILFFCSKIIKNYKIEEFIKIIRKFQEEILIIVFKKTNQKCNIKEDEKTKIYNETEIEWRKVENILKNIEIKNKKKNIAKVIAISGANGVRKKYIFHIFRKKCGKQRCKNTINRF